MSWCDDIQANLGASRYVRLAQPLQLFDVCGLKLKGLRHSRNTSAIFLFLLIRIRVPTPISDDDQKYGEDLLSVLNWFQSDAPSAGRAKRRADRAKCAKLINWRQTHRLTHHCPVGCCDTEEAAKIKVWESIETVLLSAKPVIPAKNRWVKLYPCFAFWMVLLLLPGVPFFCVFRSDLSTRSPKGRHRHQC